MKNGQLLPLERCPHCRVAKPSLVHVFSNQTTNFAKQNPRWWFAYVCASCGGITLTVAPIVANNLPGDIVQTWPPEDVVAETVPQRAREFLGQALASVHAPAG